ncbi:MAG: hypothetical protein ACREQ7_17045, partial [Candidatus Binatia bacterium]
TCGSTDVGEKRLRQPPFWTDLAAARLLCPYHTRANVTPILIIAKILKTDPRQRKSKCWFQSRSKLVEQ